MYNDFCINEINSELLINYLIQYKVVDKYNIVNNIFYDMIKFFNNLFFDILVVFNGFIQG